MVLEKHTEYVIRKVNSVIPDSSVQEKLDWLKENFYIPKEKRYESKYKN